MTRQREHAEDAVAVNERAEQGLEGSLAAGIRNRNDADLGGSPTFGDQAAAVAGDRLELKKTLQRLGEIAGALPDVIGHFDKRRAIRREVRRREVGAVFIREVERSGAGIEDSHRAFHNEPVELKAAHAVGKRRADSMQEIEDTVLFGLEVLQPATQAADRAGHPENEQRHKRGDDPEERRVERCPHVGERKNDNPKSRAGNQDRSDHRVHGKKAGINDRRADKIARRWRRWLRARSRTCPNA